MSCQSFTLESVIRVYQPTNVRLTHMISPLPMNTTTVDLLSRNKMFVQNIVVDNLNAMRLVKVLATLETRLPTTSASFLMCCEPKRGKV
jgi:hypothetical protein